MPRKSETAADRRDGCCEPRYIKTRKANGTAMGAVRPPLRGIIRSGGAYAAKRNRRSILKILERFREFSGHLNFVGSTPRNRMISGIHHIQK